MRNTRSEHLLTLQGLARVLVALLALVILAATLVSAFSFQEYALANLDNVELHTPNATWTTTQTQAALKVLGWPSTTIAWLGFCRSVIGLFLIYPVLYLMLRHGAGGWFGVYASFVFALVGSIGGAFLQPFIERFSALSILDTVIGAIGWQLFFILFFFFPNGRSVPRWTRWLAFGWVTWIVVQIWNHYQPAPSTLIDDASVNLAFGLVLSALGSQFYRYLRVSTPVERQQTRLVVLVLLLILAIVGIGIPSSFYPPEPQRLGSQLIRDAILWMFFGLSFALVPLAIGVSILRYRLWDVDLVIRRTLVYGVVSAILALVFFGGVTILQAIFSAISGEQSHLAIALSTLAIAALFNPLRKRVQEFIDRRFYRQKYNAEQALAEFAATARNETDLKCLTSKLTGAVQETLQPQMLSLWLKPAGDARLAAVNRQEQNR